MDLQEPVPGDNELTAYEPPAPLTVGHERRRRIDAYFDAALDQPPAQRRAWLEQECIGDPELLREVLALIDANEHAAGILDVPAAQVAAFLAEDDGMPTVADRLGPYRLVRQIGRGGMGRVYLAVRDDAQFEQRVAIKILHHDYSPDSIGRFIAERQILASLEHANIARLLDGGTTPSGRPYFVMEFVEGEPLDEYCNRRALSLDDRLRLIQKIAVAVQHAHRNLVVHRDLKPSNILVTADGEPKLLDFGIAKLLDPDAPYQAPETRDGERVMTPEYASPEQIMALPITTAVDIYSLGLILYELLTGHRPQRRDGMTISDVERVILAQDPVVPSLAVMMTGEPRGADGARLTPDEIARDRGTTPWQLHKKLRGDLDRIVMMAIRKEPVRRYVSAEQFGADIGRYLDGEPVIARGDSTAYRVRKFITRHRTVVVAVTLVVVWLAGYVATITMKDHRIHDALAQARLEAERAEQVTAFTMDLFERAGSYRNTPVTMMELLGRGEGRAERLDAQPGAQAQLLDVIGQIYQRMGEYTRAQELLQRALAIRVRQFGDHHVATAESMQQLGALLSVKGQYAAAESLYREALHVQRELLGERHLRVARTIDGLGLLLQQQGKYVAAEQLIREALEIRRELLGRVHPDVANSTVHLAYQLQLSGLYEEAESLYEDALAMRRQLYGDEHVEVAAAMSSLGLLRFQRGDNRGAETLYVKALATRRRFLDDRHPDIATNIALLGAVQRRKGRLVAAESLYRTAITMHREALGAEHPDVAHHMNGLALVLRDRGRLAASESLYTEVLALRRRALGEEHPSIAQTMTQLAGLRRMRGDRAGAESLLVAAIAMDRKLLGDAHPRVRETIAELESLKVQGGAPGSP